MHSRGESYLNSAVGLRSWLLTTDHKRIALLYFASITFFFFVGGVAATLIRLELITPGPTLGSPDVYNRLFTMHGIVMVWFFLIPSIPTTMGNFMIPLMIGARDLAFPRLNLLSWYFFIAGGLLTIAALLFGGVDTGWTFYEPYSTFYANGYVILAVLGIFVSGFSSVLTGLNFIVTTHKLRAPGLTWYRLPVFSRRPLYGYKFVVWCSIAIAVIGFLVWGHHMFVAGQALYASLAFSILSYLVAVPSAIKVFNWIATMHNGWIRFEAPMLYAFGFIGLFTLGGLTGLFLAALAVDVHVTDTYFVVAHFHYIMVGGAVMGYFAGLHYWWPKITGRLYSQFWSRFAAILAFFGFNLTFFPQFILGYLGMPRRYQSYPPEFQVWHVLSSAGASILAVGYAMPLFYLFFSILRGKRASANPWQATGLEWTTPSPPPAQNFEHTPVVVEPPYHYRRGEAVMQAEHG